MNGSENGYAGAIFFALMSLGALVKLEDFFGWGVGALFAFLAAIFLRAAVTKSASSVEEDHQRIEIQFQQLRSKINEAANVSAEAMTSVSDAARLVQENLEVIRVRLAELDNLTQIAENLHAIRSPALEKNFSVLNDELTKNFERLNSIEEANKENLQATLKLLQVVSQQIKNQSYARDLEEITSPIILIDDEKK